MSGSFDGPRLKLNRARKHLIDLQRLIGPFVQTETNKVTVEYEAETNTRLWVLNEPAQTPGDDINPIIGDLLYNLRSSLDHLAWQLVLANGRKPKTWGTGFPVYDNVRLYVEKGLPQIEGMSERVQTAIEAAQPYHRPKTTYSTDPLALLNSLNNVYKHRHFKLVLLSVKGGVGYGGLPDDFMPAFPPIEGRTILAAWEVSDPEMQMDYTPDLDIVFADTPWGDERVLRVMQAIFRDTEALVYEIAGTGGLATQQ